MKNYIFGISIVLLFSALTPKEDGDCINIIRDYIDRMSLIGVPKDNQTYYLDMKIVTIYAPQTNTAASNVGIKMYLNSESMIYETEQFSVYQDESDAFMVLHPQKKIIWNDGGKNPNRDLDRVNIGKSQKALFENGKIVSCQELKYKGIDAKKIVLKVSEADKDALKIEEVVVFYDTGRKMVYEVDIIFEKTQLVRKQVTTYNVINFNYKAKAAGAVRNIIFAGAGRLQPKYKGYTLEKNRRT
jgi:hypothetical protein